VERDNITTAAYVLGVVLCVAYAAGGIIGWAADVTDGDGSDLAFWLVFLFGGAALIFAGLFLTRRWTRTSIFLVSVGALAGALALFWSIIAPVLALALVGLALMAGRRSTATA
jgi:hypothetical protein